MTTILGATGFVGSHLTELCKREKIPFFAPQREGKIDNKPLGNIIYCIGMTSDFRTKPYETVEAHVCKLKYVLEKCQFDSLTYLSSTRLYLKSKSKAKKLKEEDEVCLNSNDPFDLFGASKITGELLAFNSGRPNIKIVRLSNVFGNDFNSDNFVTSVIKEALRDGKVELFTTPDSEKDYIAIDDVCNSLLLLSNLKESGIYNLAFGANTTNEVILNEIQRLTGAQIHYKTGAKRICFKEIDNSKLSNSINFLPQKTILSALPEIVKEFSLLKYFL